MVFEFHSWLNLYFCEMCEGLAAHISMHTHNFVDTYIYVQSGMYIFLVQIMTIIKIAHLNLMQNY